MTSPQPLPTPNAPPVAGPYSAAVRAGDWLVLAGQVPLDPATGKLVEGDATDVQARYVAGLSAGDLIGELARTLGSIPSDSAGAEVPYLQRELVYPYNAGQEFVKALRERGGLRRVAAILYHRRAGFSANGMGVWAVPDPEILDTGRQMAAFRGISHCYQRPTYADWPYSVFTMAHGRSKDECDAVLDAIAQHTGIQERATLYSSTEFKKVRLLYFTDEYRRWESQHA